MLIGNPVKLPDSAAGHPKGAEPWVCFNQFCLEGEGRRVEGCGYVFRFGGFQNHRVPQRIVNPAISPAANSEGFSAIRF